MNADDIESLLKESNVLLFDAYELTISEAEIQHFFEVSSFAPIKRKEPDLWKKLTVKENVLHTNTNIDSYLAADLAEFIRQQLLSNGISFTYETVMSHESKIDFLQKAKTEGYRVYLYFVATEDPEINISRVNLRVLQKGHFVPPETITERYYKSLNQLKKAVKNTNRTYLFDNSRTVSRLIAEITDGEEVSNTDVVPNWVFKYLFED